MDNAETTMYNVQAIIGMKRTGGILKFNVKWEGYHPNENTWEGLSNLEPLQEHIIQYLEDEELDHIIPEVREFFNPTPVEVAEVAPEGKAAKAPKKNKRKPKAVVKAGSKRKAASPSVASKKSKAKPKAVVKAGSKRNAASLPAVRPVASKKSKAKPKAVVRAGSKRNTASSSGTKATRKAAPKKNKQSKKAFNASSSSSAAVVTRSSAKRRK